MIFPNSVLFVLSVKIVLSDSETTDHLIFVSRYLTTHLSSRAMIGRYEESTIYIPPERFLSRRVAGSINKPDPVIYTPGFTISESDEI